MIEAGLAAADEDALFCSPPQILIPNVKRRIQPLQQLLSFPARKDFFFKKKL